MLAEIWSRDPHNPITRNLPVQEKQPKPQLYEFRIIIEAEMWQTLISFDVQVSPSISGSTLTLRAPGMMAVSVDLARQVKGFRAAVWGQAVPARDCGEEVARWLSRFLLQEDSGLRLVYYPLDRPSRDVRSKNKPFPLTISDDTVSRFYVDIEPVIIRLAEIQVSRQPFFSPFLSGCWDGVTVDADGYYLLRNY